MASRTSLVSRLLALATGVGVVAGLLGATAAQAEQYQYGEFEIFFDTTVSAGVSMRTAETETRFLPSGNGGPQDTRPLLSGNLCDTTTFIATSGLVCAPMTFGAVFDPISGFATASVPDTDFHDNFDGSINTDDGRLNWDQGDLIGGTARVIHDLEVNWRNFTAFTRFNYFYDAVLDDADSAARSPLSDDTRNDVGRGFNVLDAYLGVDFELFDTGIPVNLRHGYQVINWGEGTFIQNGISVISPIDANAFRRPGSELREAFVPIHATYLQTSLPGDISFEAFYQWEWEPFRVDPAGTPFSGADLIRPLDSSGYGNLDGESWIGGSQSAGTYRRNCDFGAPSTVGVLNAIGLGLGAIGAPDPTLIPDCANAEIDMRYDIPIGMNEYVRRENGDLNRITRRGDEDASDGGEYGFAARYYADWFNATEFGAYYINYHSRLPIVAVQPASRGPQVHISTTGPSTSALSRQVMPVGCLTDASLGLAGVSVPDAFHPNGMNGVGFIGGGHFPLYALSPGGGGTYENLLGAYAITTAMDPNGYMAAVAPIAEAILFATGTTTIATGAGDVTLAAPGDFVALPNTMLKLMQINCALAAVQSGMIDFSYDPGAEGGLSPLAPQLATGAETLGFSTQHTQFLQYPEDIHLFGVSFNTTIGTWGVQGEFTYRSNQPLQLDTDMLTISSGLQQCGFPPVAGDLGLIFEGLANGITSGAISNCNPAQQIVGAPRPLDGYIREEVFTGQIGTTATFTRSNPLIGMLGADLGIFVTEAGFVLVPDVPDEGDFSRQQLASNGCQGSDLPLGGLLGLDGRSGCRVTDMSYGYVLLGRLDYNNVMGAFTVSPLVAFSHDVEGYTPAPLGNYLEDRMSATFQIGASYQNTWNASLGYNTYFGGGIRNKASDRDFASFNISYSF